MESCGYQGHICGRNGQVQFISRYRDENDYCVGGQRIAVHDDGTVHSYPAPTPEHLQAIRLYEIQKYGEYVLWHAKQEHGPWLQLQSFDFPAVLVVI